MTMEVNSSFTSKPYVTHMALSVSRPVSETLGEEEQQQQHPFSVVDSLIGYWSVHPTPSYTTTPMILSGIGWPTPILVNILFLLG